jgi:uncharacterized protein Yka (UPF0111/DUF47 family)
MIDELVKSGGPIVGGIAALITACMALISWSYETFETKDISKERLHSIERRLERIEEKIDTIRTRH